MDCNETGGGTLHSIVTNANSISVELCDSIRNGVSDFTENTLGNAANLVRELMKKYGIDIHHVCRHFDVTGKMCPLPMVDCLVWNAFKQRLEEKTVEVTRKEFEELKHLVKQLSEKQEKVYHYWSELPEYARDIIQELYTRGIYHGNGDSDLNLPESLMRCLVINYRTGIYK
jgi:N-acetylmuramoyl-L-alanine amidase CwlA